MKPADAKSSRFTDFHKENNKEAPKFKFDDNARISKYANIFAKGYTLNWSVEGFVIKNTVLWTYVISDFNGEDIVGTFDEEELQKTNKNEVKDEKVIKRKGIRLYVKWKGYNSFFNSWIDKKDIV